MAARDRTPVPRDHGDGRSLEVAMAGEDDVIVSGDEDLLVLHPLVGTNMLPPDALLRMLDAAQQ